MQETITDVLTKGMILEGFALLGFVLAFAGLYFRRYCLVEVGLPVVAVCTLVFFLLPYLSGFAFHGDTLRHLPWIREILNGERTLVSSYYLSFYAFAVFGMNHFDMSVMAVYPGLTYGIYVLGFGLLARQLTDYDRGRALIMLFALAFLFGFSHISIQPYFFGLALVPSLLAIQLMLAERYRWWLIVISGLLFGIVVFSHPLHLLLCSLLIAVFWTVRVKRCRRLLAYPLPLAAIVIGAALFYATNDRIQLFAVEVASRLGGGLPMWSVFSREDSLWAFLARYGALFGVLLGGLGASVFFIIRRDKEYRYLALLFVVFAVLGTIGLSGVFLIREFTRLYSYAVILGLTLMSLWVVRKVLDRPRCVWRKLAVPLCIMACYSTGFLNITMRFPYLIKTFW